MINTVDKYGTKRTLSLTNWNLLPVNANGTKGNNELRQEIDSLQVDQVELDIKAFIEKKRCKNDPEKECDNTCVEETPFFIPLGDSNESDEEIAKIFLESEKEIRKITYIDLEKASVEVQSEPTLAIQKPKQTRKKRK